MLTARYHNPKCQIRFDRHKGKRVAIMPDRGPIRTTLNTIGLGQTCVHVFPRRSASTPRPRRLPQPI
jgi:hypothetical protein